MIQNVSTRKQCKAMLHLVSHEIFTSNSSIIVKKKIELNQHHTEIEQIICFLLFTECLVDTVHCSKYFHFLISLAGRLPPHRDLHARRLTDAQTVCQKEKGVILITLPWIILTRISSVGTSSGARHASTRSKNLLQSASRRKQCWGLSSPKASNQGLQLHLSGPRQVCTGTARVGQLTSQSRMRPSHSLTLHMRWLNKEEYALLLE